MNKRWVGLAVIFFVTLLIGFGSATITYRNSTVGKQYYSGELISGNLDVRLTNENAETILHSNFIGNITLKDFISRHNLTIGENYNCTYRNCMNDYSPANQLSTFLVTNKKTIGFVIDNADVSEIQSARFRLTGDNGPSCTGNIKVKIAENNETYLTNNKHTGTKCSVPNYGCFESNLSSYSMGRLTGDSLCEKITILPSAAYTVGAKISKSGTGNASILLELRELNGDLLDECAVTMVNGVNQDVNCIVSYSSANVKDVLACARIDNVFSGEPVYEIRFEKSGQICGTDSLSTTYTKDYEIYASTMQFGQLDLSVNDTLMEQLNLDSLSTYFQQYLEESYDSTDSGIKCEPHCVIPIIIESASQTVTVTGVEMVYLDGSTQTTKRELRDLTIEQSKIDAGFIRLDLAKAGFKIPINSKEKEFILYANGNEIFRKSINITQSFIFDITPKIVLVGVPTTLRALTNENISSSVWKFGDETKTSDGKSIVFSTLGRGNISVEVELTNTKGVKSKRAFEISVGEPKEAANFSIERNRALMENLTRKMDSFPQWIKVEIEKKLNLGELNATLSAQKVKFDSAESDEDYINIVTALNEINLPTNLVMGQPEKLPIGIGYENIDTSLIEESSGREIEDDSALKKSIIAWSDKNFDAEFISEKISLYRDSATETIATKFTLNIKRKEVGDPAHLIINHPIENIKFLRDYGAKPLSFGSSVDIALSSDQEEIEFLIPSLIETSELGAYLSPTVDKLSITSEDVDLADKPKFNWTRFTIGMMIVLIMFFTLYIIVQEWYKKKYEGHLFRNRDDLYNIINFIYNNRGAGRTDADARRGLQKSGWANEQVTYAIRKLNGERTGMFEIPLFKARENKVVRDEISKRQKGNIDARFIKRPNL